MNVFGRVLSLGSKAFVALSLISAPALAQSVTGACLYSLDPTAQNAFVISGSTAIYSGCSLVVESNATQAFDMQGSETLYLQNHAQVGVVGGWQLSGNLIKDTISNQIVQPVKIASPGDPLASIQAPTSGTIVATSHKYYDMNSKPPNNTIPAGVYCGGLAIGNTNGATFTLSPGTYVMAGGGFTVNSQGIVSGSGVTIYNTSSSGWGCSGSGNYTPIVISGQTKVTLSAPTTGPLAGILIFGNRTGCSTPGSCQDQVNGGSTSNFNGAVYVKSDNLLFSGSNPSGSCMVAVADIITINGSSTFGDTGCAINPVSVSVSPQTASLYAGQSQQFAATVTNSNNSAVTWSISPSGSGTITLAGLYTGPGSVTTQQTVTVTATSQADTSKSASATVTLLVRQTTPTITWAAPAAITYGTALSATQLNATASVQGTFAYTPAAGTIPGAGTQTLSVTFTPTDTTDYTTATSSVHLTVNKATPAITWAVPAAISYGTPLGSSQLDATSIVAGSFAYSPASGIVLTAGTQTLSTTFTPTDSADYLTATGSVHLTVNRAAPVITWPSPTAIAYGTALSATQLDASSTVAGSFVYSPAAGTVLTAGTQTLSTTFTPTDTTDYNGATATTSVLVSKATPAIAWPAPAAITYGIALSATQLDATSLVAGSFAYSPSAGTVLPAGAQTLSTTLTPTDTTDYGTATSSVALTVNKAAPTITWAAPAAITYGAALTAAQLNASSSVPGTFSYAPAAGTTLPAGIQVLSVTFTPIDTADYTTTTTNVSLVVNKATPPITWVAPAAITYGTALSSAQLNATSTVQGIFSYTPALGAILPAGTQTLSATFTPTDSADYTTATATVSLLVNKATPPITWAQPAAITYGTALSATQLNATSSVAGSFAYAPALGAVLPAGARSLAVTFTPTDTVDYSTALSTVTLTVNSASPLLTWATPAPITYGAALSLAQLNATATIPGTFVYSPTTGTVPTAGTQTLSVTFTPTDTTDYAPAISTISLIVNKAIPTITWPTPTAITSGTALSAIQLDASASVNGSFAYSPASGIILPEGMQTLSVSFTPNDAVDYTSAADSVTLIVNSPPISVAVSPTSATLNAGQTQQFSATISNTGNTVANWTISPSGLGTIDQTGLYTAPATISTQQTVTVTATSQADTTQSASAIVTLNPTTQCTTSGYSSARVIIIDHTKVPNTDQTNFPFLFNTADPSFATTANGGQVTNANGYDIIFSTDPNGATKLDHELEEYNPATGQVIAWVRIPTLSHTADTVIYMLYGNSNVSTPQQNPNGVWDANYKGVWHVANGSVLSLVDSTVNGDNGTNEGAVAAAGQIDGGMLTDGTTFATLGTSQTLADLALGNATFSAWVNTTTEAGGIVMGRDDRDNTAGWALSIDRNGIADFTVIHEDEDFILSSSAPVGNSQWSYIVVTLAGSAGSSQGTIYVNGTQSATGSGGLGLTIDDSSLVAYLANATYGYGGYTPFAGSTDEFRISNTIRSADWIATEYNNQSSPSAFYSLGSAFFAISPNSVTLYPSQTQPFTATAINSCSSGATWTISPSSLGSISSTGVYTAPAAISAPQTVTVTATSTADSSKSATATIQLSPPISISLTPALATVTDGGQQQQFTASVFNTSNSGVNWSVNPGIGSIDANGLYTAPNSITATQTVTVTATSQADLSQAATATITLVAPSLPAPICASNGYSFMRAIVIDHTLVPNTDQANFPFLFNSTDPAFATTANGGHLSNVNGDDIIFSTDPGGLNPLPYDLEKYNSATGQVIAWVKLPNLSHTTDTVLYMFYGNDGVTAPQQNPSVVWDSSYLGVWHVPNGTKLSLADSSTYGNNASNDGAIAAAGQIDGGMSTDGSTYATIGAPSSLANLTQGNATFSAWVNVAGPGGVIMGKEDPNDNVGWELEIDDPTNSIFFESNYSDRSIELSNTGATAGKGKWSYITVTLAGTPNNGGQATIYINGVPSGTGSGSGQSGDDSGQSAYLGNISWDWPLEGLTDEFRISNVVRSPDWIATEFNNQGSPSTFYQLLGENVAGVAPASATLYASQNEQLAAVAPCSAPAVIWSMDPNAPGTLTSGGLYTAPLSIGAEQTVSVTATSQTDGSTLGSALLTLFPPVQVSLAPSTATISASRETLQFTATVVNAKNNSVIWSISPTNVGSIDASGLYTAPYLRPYTSQTVTITATSVIDPTQSASATITLAPVAISPQIGFIYGGLSEQFSANVPVVWSATGGTITSGGVFTGPINSAGNSNATVTATSPTDPLAFYTISFTVYPPPHSITPGLVTLYGGQTQQFSACMPIDAQDSQCAPSVAGWSISPAGAGSIDSNGNYIAPAVIYNQQTVIVTATNLLNPAISATATITLVPPKVTVSPESGTLYSGQSEQFFSTITNISDTRLSWSISPTGVGSLSATGLYQAPNGILSQQVLTITATSQALPSFSASATVILSPTQCLSKDYANVRSIVIDHNKVPNTDQANFPFLLSAVDPVLASTSNGGHVASSYGYDIVFASDPAGKNRLDYELEQYNPATGQIIAWIRVPVLSHTSNTVIYMFYGNPAITGSQQNAGGVWDKNYQGVYHLANTSSTSAVDSTGLRNNAPATGLAATPGVFDATVSFDGSTSYLTIPSQEVENYPASGVYTTDFSSSFATWFKTSTEGVILGQTGGGTAPNGFPNGGWIPALYVDNAGILRGSFFNLVNADQSYSVFGSGINYSGVPQITTTRAYNDNQWHYAALTYGGGTESMYVDGKMVGTQYAALQSGYYSSYDYFVGTAFSYDWPGVNQNSYWNYLNGSLEEVEFSSNARSGDWLRAEYLNQSSPSTFSTLSPELSGNTLISPLSATLYGGQNQQFTILDAGLCGAGGAAWSMPAGGPGKLSAAGLYTAPANIETQLTVPITATTVGSTSTSVTATVILLPAVSISVTPSNAILAAGQTQQFSASVGNASNTAVTWTISPTGVGSITSNGSYTAPATLVQQEIVTVTATSVADVNQFASATILLTPPVVAPPVAVNISPVSSNLAGGQSQQFTAVVSNSTNTSVTWSILPADLGSISATGLYTAPPTVAVQQAVTVIATSQADPTQSASAIVTLSVSQCASSGYTYQRAIVIDHTKISNTDQSNFPLLFNTTDPNFESVANGGHVTSSNGYDIIFSTDPNGITRLDHELESYNPATGQVIAWVRVPAVSHTSDTVLYVFYGNPNVTQPQANSVGVWDDNYQGVWHLANGTTLSANDSTANANNGSNNGVAATSGLIDGAGSFDGSSSYIDVGSLGALPIKGTISFWMNANSLSSYPNAFTTNYNGGNNAIRFEEDSNGDFGVAIGSGNFNGYGYMSASMQPNTWYNVVLTWNSNASTATGFLNGHQVFNTTTNTLWPSTIADLAIGVGWDTSRVWNGLIDEVRLSDTARSPDWISAEFNNQNSPGTFFSLEPESTIGIAPQTVTLYPSQSQQFGAAIPGSCGTNLIRWSMSTEGPGTLSANGLYVAPSSIASQQTVAITATSQSNASLSATATITLMPSITVSVSPSSATLNENQSELFTALVTNSPNTAVTWSVSPAGMGSIDPYGAYTAPGAISSPQQVTITAESAADITKFGSATVTVTPTQCASATYGYQRVIVIDHTKVGSADLADFPFLFNTTDQDLASVDNGGHVASSNGYDILFSTDPNGTTKLDYELEKYNSSTGQVVAWIRIPTLSHTTDTVLYVFYGNSSIGSSQQNPAGVWNPSYLGVYHFANGQLQDSTRNTNNATPTSTAGVLGLFDEGLSFSGSSSYFELPATDFPNYPTGVYDNVDNPDYTPPITFSSSFGVWFKTNSPGGLLGQVPSISCTAYVFWFCIGDGPTLPGYYDPASWNAMLYLDDNGKLVGGGVSSSNSYDDNTWHYAVVTYALDGTDTLYVDGQSVGSTSNQFPTGYSPGYNYFVGTSYTFLSNDGNWDWLYLNGSVDEVKVTNTPLSGAWVQTEFNNQSSPSTFYKFYTRSTTQVAPASVSLYALQAQQFAVPGICDSAVNWSLASGAAGSLTANGLYTAPSTVPALQTLDVSATSRANGGNLGTATVTLLTAPPPITLTTTTQPPYQQGSTQSFTATLLDADGTPSTGVTVAFAVTGPNAAFANATTDDNGVATYSYLGANSGTDKIQATASLDGELQTSNSLNATWLSPINRSPAAAVTLLAPPSLGVAGLLGAFTDNAGNVIEPVAIGATARSLPVPNGATQLQLGINSQYYPQDGGSGFTVLVNGTPTTVPPTAMPWVWTTGGQNAAFQYGIYNPSVQSGILDGTPPVIAAKNLSAGSTLSIAYQSGTASINLPVRPLVNADGDQSWTPGTEIWQGAAFATQYTTTKAYPVGQPITFDALVLDVTGAPMANVPVTLTISGANPQTLQSTTDATGKAAFLYTGAYAGTDSLVAQAFPSGAGVLTSGLGGVTWVNRPASSVPGSLALSYFGYVNIGQVYTLLATDSSGKPVGNANIGYYVWGVDNFSQAGTTDFTGHGGFGYNHYDAGAFNIVAVETLNGNTIFSNVVSGNWAFPPKTTQCGYCDQLTASISGPNSVTLPNAVTLTGTITDSVGLTPTVSWTQISGPGTVTFATPDQATTNASFTQPGVYVVQLYATDTGASASVQFTITVNQAQATGVSQGWIGSPLYGAKVSGIVPITLASGVSLQSGTLTYFPTTNTSNVTVLNANTTGSGQVGALDTTQLPNGSYWIQLNGVDAHGDSQYNLILVTATGDYKPGRVTSTVTDLVVPSTGLSINIQRTYDSLNAATSSDFGYGWSLGINVSLTVSPSGDVTFTLGGQRKTFYLAPQMPPCTPLIGCLFPYYFVAYSPQPGLHGTLTTSDQACPLNIVVPNGNIWDCQGGGQFNPSGYVYTDPNGTAYNISAKGSLQSISDRNGNGLTITPNGITSTTGLSVPFLRDSSGRITRITDPQGNDYLYTYDNSGNLATVTYPNTSQPSTYTYDPNHLYLSGTDFRSNPLPSTSYFVSTINSSGLCEGDCDPNGLPLNGRLKSVTDALNETTTYAYDLVAQSTTITYPQDANGNRGTATMVYSALGDLLSSTDPLGLTTTNAYDVNRNLVSVTDPMGHMTTYAYDSNGNRSSTTYPATATSTNTTSSTVYNQYSEPISTTDELGNVRNFNYDGNYNPQSVTDGLGTLASFQFNSNGTLAAGAIGFDISVNPSQASQFTYDANGNMGSRTDALGRSTSYTYNSLGQKTSMVEPLLAGTSASAATTTYSYDAFGNLTQTAAPLGRTTSSTYDGNGNKISDTDARSNSTNYAYDPLNRLSTTTYPTSPATTSTKTYDFRGNVLTETDQAGHITQHVYDIAGRQTSVTQAYGTSNATTTTYAYDNAGRKTSETDALGHTTTYTYDPAGNMTGVSGVNGSFTYAYDNARNRVSMTDGNGNATQYKYDARKRLIETDYPDGTKKTNTYDGPGNLASVTDQNGNTVQYTYDASNQLQSVTQTNSPNAPNNVTSYGYSVLGDLTGLNDANSHLTENRFDLLSQPVSKTLPDGSLTETRQYDPAGNLTSLTHFNGKTTTYAYDSLNRLLSRTPDPTTGEPTVSFTYTATGKRHTMTDASGTTSYSYDSMDRLTQKATPEGTLNYTYDAAGHLASMTSSHANGVSVSYTYDSLNRLSTVVDARLPGNQTTTYAHDNANNVATVTYPNGVQTALSYDQLNRLKQLATSQTGYLYTFDNAGNRKTASEYNGRSVAWNFDGIYRLTGETITGAAGNANGTASYVLDPVGNRDIATSSIPGLSPIGGTFNADDELASESYDSDGNVTASGGKTFSYDTENHLMSMNGGAVNILYDGDGNRVAKIVSGVTTRYLVDDLNPTGYAQVVEELSGAGPVQRQYTYGLQRISQNQLISNTWTPSFYGYDGFGTVRQLTNSAAAITDTYDYDAFGNKINSTGSTPNNYLYRGEQYDSDLGLYYLRARYMNPLTGRFMGRDPIDGSTYDPATLHKYAYAEDDPVNGSDPTGQMDGTAGTMPGTRTGVGSAIGEYAVIVLQALSASVAVADVGCAANYAYEALALKLANDANITKEGCDAKGEGRMRIQLQKGSETVPGSPVLTNDDPPGVTTAQVFGGLTQIWLLAKAWPDFPFNSEERDLRSAIISVSQCAKSFKPYGFGIPKKSLCTAPVGDSGWRVDLDNLNGTNLRQ